MGVRNEIGGGGQSRIWKVGGRARDTKKSRGPSQMGLESSTQVSSHHTNMFRSRNGYLIAILLDWSHTIVSSMYVRMHLYSDGLAARWPWTSRSCDLSANLS